MASKKSYEPIPQIPEESLERFLMTMGVWTGELTVSEAARRLSISRNHFQTLLHRGLKGLIDGISPHPPGRPARSSRQRQVEEENERLIKEVRRLQSRADTTDRLLKVAGDLLKGRVQSSARGRAKRTSSTQKGQEETDEDGLRARIQGAREMIALGLSRAIAATVAGAGVSTLRRWFRRERQGEVLRHRRGPTLIPPPEPRARSLVAGLVRQLHGLAGAAALSKSVPGVSRRQAAEIKQQTLTQMERERIGSCHHLFPTAAGLIRGFDQLELTTTAGLWYGLISSDTAVPFRTSALLTPRYDGRSVTLAVQRDFALHGAPLVWRADRAKAHDAPQVREILDHYKVLPLHGPPRLPRYYGSLERQNRDHRAWLAPLGTLDPAELDDRFGSMLDALNNRWRLRSLGFHTPAEAWAARPAISIDRDDLRLQVDECAARLSRHLDARASYADLAQRLAIEQTLTQRGLLGRSNTRRC